MFVHVPRVRRPLRALLAIAVLGGIAGFARPVTPAGPQTVQVRDFPSASTVTVVAWSTAAPTYGLRTAIPRKGGSWRYHWLYVATNAVSEGRDITKATGMSRSLQTEMSVRDDQNCLAEVCSPSETFRARIPDDLLRANLDNISVKFLTGSGSEVTFTIRRELADAYLAAVDSARTALARP